jgi:hypothetical protein
MSPVTQPTINFPRMNVRQTKTLGVPNQRLSFTLEHTPPEGAMDEAIQRALNRIGVRWQAGAKLAAPVDSGRLRSSITFCTPTTRALHTTVWKGGVESYMPPMARKNSVHVGTNVDYARAVHEGVMAHMETVLPHTVRAHKRKTKHGVVTVRAHYRGMHSRRVPYRAPNKFIEKPAISLMRDFRKIFEQEFGGI